MKEVRTAALAWAINRLPDPYGRALYVIQVPVLPPPTMVPPPTMASPPGGIVDDTETLTLVFRSEKYQEGKRAWHEWVLKDVQ